MAVLVPFTLPTNQPTEPYKINSNFRKLKEYIDANVILADGSVAFTGDIEFADGSAANPSVTFTADTTDGFFHSNTFGKIGVSSGGTEVCQFTAFGLSIQSNKRFFLQDGSAASPSATFGADQNTGFYRKTTDSIGVSTNGTEVAYWDASGNYISGGNVRSAQGTAGSPSHSFVSFTNHGMFVPASGSLAWAVSGSEKMRVGSRGLAINTTDTTNYWLRIDADVNTTQAIRIDCSLENTTTSQTAITVYHGANNGNSPSTDDYFATWRKGDGTVVGSINGTGSSGVNYNTTSDSRLKESIEANPEVGDIIDALTVHKFSWKETGVVEYGVFAQEALPVYSPPITEGEDVDLFGSFQPWVADYSRYVGLLLAEIKSLRGRVRALEAA